MWKIYIHPSTNINSIIKVSCMHDNIIHNTVMGFLCTNVQTGTISVGFLKLLLSAKSVCVLRVHVPVPKAIINYSHGMKPQLNSARTDLVLPNVN